MYPPRRMRFLGRSYNSCLVGRELAKYRVAYFILAFSEAIANLVASGPEPNRTFPTHSSIHRPTHTTTFTTVNSRNGLFDVGGRHAPLIGQQRTLVVEPFVPWANINSTRLLPPSPPARATSGSGRIRRWSPRMQGPSWHLSHSWRYCPSVIRPWFHVRRSRARRFPAIPPLPPMPAPALLALCLSNCNHLLVTIASNC